MNGKRAVGSGRASSADRGGGDRPGLNLAFNWPKGGIRDNVNGGGKISVGKQTVAPPRGGIPLVLNAMAAHSARYGLLWPTLITS